MKKLLFVNSSLSGGGSERVMTLLANEFSKDKSIETSMVLLREKKDYYKVDSNIQLYRFKYNTKSKIIIAIKRFFYLRQLVKKNKYDYIISFMYDINIFTLLTCLGLKSKIIVSERNYPDTKLRKKTRIIENVVYRLAHKVVFQTYEAKKLYKNEIQQKSVIISNPINNNLPSVYHGTREKIIVSVGRLTEQKNFKMLINAFYDLYKNYPIYKLIIYGEGPLRYNLQSQIKDLDLENNVELPGFFTDVNDRIRKASIFVLPSNYEGISNAMLEAMALGIPTICTDCPVGGASMVIQNNVNGILISVNNKDELVRAMLRVIEDENFARKISQNAYKIRKKLSSDSITKKWNDIIKG